MTSLRLYDILYVDGADKFTAFMGAGVNAIARNTGIPGQHPPTFRHAFLYVRIFSRETLGHTRVVGLEQKYSISHIGKRPTHDQLAALMRLPNEPQMFLSERSSTIDKVITNLVKE